MTELMTGVYLRRKKPIKTINYGLLAIAIAFAIFIVFMNGILPFYVSIDSWRYHAFKITEIISIMLAVFTMVFAIFAKVETGNHYLYITVDWNHANIRQLNSQYVIVDTIVDGSHESVYKVVRRDDSVFK